MRADRRKCFISPLAIDELPIVSKSKNCNTEMIEFSCNSDRWSLNELWGDDQLPILPANTENLRFPVDQIGTAAGAMQTDVRWRDRRLVLQSNSLTIVCPKLPNEDRITRGVKDEITTAIMMGIICNVWQNPEWDRDDFVGKEIFDAGSMGIGQTQETVQRFGSLEDVIRASP